MTLDADILPAKLLVGTGFLPVAGSHGQRHQGNVDKWKRVVCPHKETAMATWFNNEVVCRFSSLALVVSKKIRGCRCRRIKLGVGRYS